MKFYKFLLILFYPIVKTLNDLLSLINNNKKNKLRVLILHDIPEEEIACFNNLILWLKKRWNFITPEVFESMINGHVPIIGRNLLLTFDDGFISNYNVSTKVLKNLNIKAVFFVISDFINMTNPAEIKNFIYKNIQLSTNKENIKDEQLNMKWEHLQSLLEDGHTIGAHTKSHKSLVSMTTSEEITDELIKSADYIQEKLNYSIKHFAFPFGNLKSINKNSYNIAIKRFEYVYSGFRGPNFANNRSLIRRDAISTKESKYLIGSYLEGTVDFLYKESISKLSNWIKFTS